MGKLKKREFQGLVPKSVAFKKIVTSRDSGVCYEIIARKGGLSMIFHARHFAILCREWVERVESLGRVPLAHPKLATTA